MITLLSKPFLKAGDSETRRRQVYGTVCGGVGVLSNLLLFLGKLIAGLISGSLAVLTDGMNNLSDAATALLTVLGFRMAAKKPDRRHPFGHGRIEYLTGLLVSVSVILLGFELGQGAVKQILRPTPIRQGLLPLIVMTLSIPFKLGLFALNRRTGRMLDSTALKAAAADCITDALAGTVTLLSLLLSDSIPLPLDGLCGGALAIMIMVSGVRMVLDTVSPLLGQQADPALVARIVEIVGSYPEVLGLHDLIVHDYGPRRRMISLHAEVDSREELVRIHATIDELEMRLMDELDCPTVIHMDPIAVDDARLAEIKETLSELVTRIHPTLSVHDVRLMEDVRHCKLIFDLAVLEDGPGEEWLEQTVREQIAARYPGIEPVLRIERAFAEPTALGRSNRARLLQKIGRAARAAEGTETE